MERDNVWSSRQVLSVCQEIYPVDDSKDNIEFTIGAVKYYMLFPFL